MTGTAVPPLVFTDRGFVAPSASAILAGVQSDINAAFGGKVNPALTTGLGQLASSETAIISDANAALVSVFNGVDPALASGRQQDAIARIYFLRRNPALPTTATATCTGQQGVVIPIGALAQDTSGNLYMCTSGGTIPVGGSIDLQFACTQTGPIALAANSLTIIYQAIPGWDTINNVADGVLGNDVESRSAFETRRAASVAVNAKGSLNAVLGAVLNVPDVLDVYVTENTSNTSQTVGGVSLNPNSLYVAVVGGNSLAVATAIWSRKSPGCNYTGNTTETVYDTNSGYSIPYPSYSVTFEIPTPTAIKFAVSCLNNNAVPADAATQIQNAIISAFAGGDGGPRARIGSIIFASRFYAPIAALGPWVQLVSVLIGTSSATLNDVTMNINQAPTVAGADISVVFA